MKIKILRNFNGNVAGESWRFSEGETREVPDGPAKEFIRGHYAERVDEIAVKVVRKPQERGRKARIK